jgi:2-polyprenyl-3-methyl-5-hydroxy-6-metoxy-1,4-benzoquinol methylase
MNHGSVEERAIENSRCYLCGRAGVTLYENQRDRLWNAPGVWNLMRCPDCDFIWLNPKPAPEDIQALYADYYTHDIDTGASGKLDFSGLGFKKKIKYSILRSGFNYDFVIPGFWAFTGKLLSSVSLLKELTGRNIMYLEGHRRGTLLDVGCGNGKFLSEMRSLGWDVYGVEPDPQAIRIAKEEMHLDNVSRGMLEDAGYPDDYFDVITMSHVIEHLHDPLATLAECRRILKPKGLIVIATPNINGLACKIFGENARHMEVPRHLFLFSPESIKAVLLKSGFKFSRQRYTLENAYIWKASYRIFRGAPAGEVRVRKFERLLVALFEYLICSLNKNLSEELVVTGGKP